MENKIIHKAISKTGKTISFRYPTNKDAQIITDFMNKASQEKTYISFQGEELKLEKEKKWLKSTIRDIKNKEKIYIMVFIDNKLVGSSDIVLEKYSRKHVGVFGIIIDHDYRGEGIGKTLMKLVISEAIKKIKGLKIIILDVFCTNIIAQDLYKKMGFTEYGRLPKGLKRRGKYVDMVLMQKKVK